MNNRIFYAAALLAMLCLSAACGDTDAGTDNGAALSGEARFTDKSDAAKYMQMAESPEGGYLKLHKDSGYVFASFLRTATYDKIRELQDQGIPAKKITQLVKDVKDTGELFFVFYIRLPEGEAAQWKEKQKHHTAYLDFGMQQSFRLVKHRDTIPCSFYHYEHSDGVAPVLTCLVGFNERYKDSEPFSLLYTDSLFTFNHMAFNY